jgi:enoyl-CoA hydratase/carnithine racemase
MSVTSHTADRITVVTIDRPERRNALTVQAMPTWPS